MTLDSQGRCGIGESVPEYTLLPILVAHAAEPCTHLPDLIPLDTEHQQMLQPALKSARRVSYFEAVGWKGRKVPVLLPAHHNTGQHLMNSFCNHHVKYLGNSSGWTVEGIISARFTAGVNWFSTLKPTDPHQFTPAANLSPINVRD